MYGPAKKWVALACAGAVLGMLAGSAHAARGGNGGGKGHVTTSASESRITLNQDPNTLRLGSQVTFTSTWTGVSGNEFAQIGLQCYQAGAVVYGELQAPDYTFTLGAGSSKWTGGGAQCTGRLLAYGLAGGAESIRLLASTTFTVG
jgi:hypothetical protein